MNKNAQLHISEKYTEKDGSPIFEGYMTGDCLGAFGSLAGTHCAMTSTQAIAYKCEVEKRAFEWSNASKIDGSGNPSFTTVSVEVIIERIS